MHSLHLIVLVLKQPLVEVVDTFHDVVVVLVLLVYTVLVLLSKKPLVFVLVLVLVAINALHDLVVLFINIVLVLLSKQPLVLVLLSRQLLALIGVQALHVHDANFLVPPYWI